MKKTEKKTKHITRHKALQEWGDLNSKLQLLPKGYKGVLGNVNKIVAKIRTLEKIWKFGKKDFSLYIKSQKSTTKKIHFFDIKWDKEGHKVRLPKKVTLTVEKDFDVECEGSDLLSDEFGYCHFGWNWKEVK